MQFCFQCNHMIHNIRSSQWYQCLAVCAHVMTILIFFLWQCVWVCVQAHNGFWGLLKLSQHFIAKKKKKIDSVVVRSIKSKDQNLTFVKSIDVTPFDSDALNHDMSTPRKNTFSFLIDHWAQVCKQGFLGGTKMTVERYRSISDV